MMRIGLTGLVKIDDLGVLHRNVAHRRPAAVRKNEGQPHMAHACWLEQPPRESVLTARDAQSGHLTINSRLEACSELMQEAEQRGAVWAKDPPTDEV